MTAALDHREQQALLEQELDRCWPIAQEYWSRFLLLGRPIDDPAQSSIAQIDLISRQVSINAPMIIARGLIDSTEAILAHEIGHHVRYPGTLQTQARMRVLERSIIPFDEYSLINLFTDMMINERLGRHLQVQMVRIYRAFTFEPAFHHEGKWKRDPLFLFYLAVYEELWRLEGGELIGPATAEFQRAFPSYRAEANLLAQNLFHLGPNVFTQFLYFLSIASRYLQPIAHEQPVAVDPYQCGRSLPTADDWGEAITPTAREMEAIRRARDEGWFDDDQGQRLDEAAEIERRLATLPGFGTPDASLVPEAMAAFYRQKAEQYLLRPPPQPRWGEAHTPTTFEDWEHGDAPRDIDWLATLIARGFEYGSAAPLKRSKVAEEEGYDVPLWQPRMEIYLDVSGSMPNPCLALNPMTLAAQILSLGTVRAGGRVRAVLYSSDPLPYWEWCQSEVEISRFLMHYLGGGTEFPFYLLEKSVQECGTDQPIRVIISDTDFDHNYQEKPRNAEVFRQAAARSARLVLLQHCPSDERVRLYRGQGASVIEVIEMDGFPKLAADLTFALFPEGQHDVL